MNGLFSNNETVNLHSKIDSDNFVWGLVDKVDTHS